MSYYGNYNANVQQQLSQITAISDDTPSAEQPSKIKIPLKVHQLKLLYRCIELESGYKQIDKDTKMTTRCGIIGDKVGAGKSYVALSLVANNHDFKGKSGILHHNPMDLYSIIGEKNSTLTYMDTTLLIVPHSIVGQWSKYIKDQTTLTCDIVKKHSDIGNTSYDTKNANKDKIEKFTKDIVLVSSSMARDFDSYYKCHQYEFKRLMIDECDTINVPNFPDIRAKFSWFITSSINNLLLPKATREYYYVDPYGNEVQQWQSGCSYKMRTLGGIKRNGLIKNTFLSIAHDQTYRRHLFLKNPNDFVDASLGLHDPVIHNIKCKNTKISNVLSGIVSESVQQKIYAGDIESAIKEVDYEETTEDNLIKIVARNLYDDLENEKLELEMKKQMKYKDPKAKLEAIKKIKTKIADLEEKIDNIKRRVLEEELDPITYDEIKNPVVTKCCKNVFDFESITLFMTTKTAPKCPLCKATLNKDQLVMVKEEEETFIEEELDPDADSEEQMSPDLEKDENLKILIGKLRDASKPKILIFSEHDGSFAPIIKILDGYKMNYHYLKGTGSSINKTINEYKTGDIDVLLLNARFFGAGLNLENTSDVIIYHKMNEMLTNQVIGRANRLGRTGQLNVWKLLYSSET